MGGGGGERGPVPRRVAQVAVCCSVLQCVAVCCSVLQCVAVPRREARGAVVRVAAAQCASSVCCGVLQCVAAPSREAVVRVVGRAST